MFTDANLRPVQRWMDPTSRYSLWLLERPPFTFPLLKSPDAVAASTPFSIPSPAEWETIWSAWDMITMGMISPQLLYEKPIDLRHICLFYLGHIPTFLDIHLSRLLGEPHTEPDNFKVNPGLPRSFMDTNPPPVYLRERDRPQRRRSNSVSCKCTVGTQLANSYSKSDRSRTLRYPRIRKIGQRFQLFSISNPGFVSACSKCIAISPPESSK